MRVRLTKFAVVADPVFQPGNPHDYHYGNAAPKCSLPVGYWAEGFLLNPPHVGDRVEILRDVRNGVETVGVFTSSKVTEVIDDGFSTLNSAYKLERILAASNLPQGKTTQTK